MLSNYRINFNERHYFCGTYDEIIIFPCPADVAEKALLREPNEKESRSPRDGGGKREEEKQRANRRAENRLLRLVRTNFSTADLALHLTYKEEQTSLDLAKKGIQNFFRRLKRAYKKNGIELKYIWVLDKGKKTGRIHFHAIISGGLDEKTLESIWGSGFARANHLHFGKNALKGFVQYILKCKLLYRRYSCSKNLDKPIVSTSAIQPTARDIYQIAREQYNALFFEKRYPGYKYVDCKVYRADDGRAPVIRILMIKARGENENEP